ncbi:MAG: hypothetical protein WA736_12315 [Candidatus Acidiferrum sp.]
MAMAVHAKRSLVSARLWPSLWPRIVASAIFLLGAALSGFTQAQIMQGPGSKTESPSSVRGKVLNRVTHEPISRALVFSPDQQYATLTDDEGRFEFKFPPPEPESTNDSNVARNANALGARQIRLLRNSRPMMYLARKLGFLDSTNNPSNNRVTPDQSEIVIYLDPESLIVGHVNIPGSEGEMRIRVDLYRREIREGQEHWESLRSFTTWTNGEFRFWDLSAGTYKLGTAELLDRDPLVFTPGGQLFGFPPIFYPSASDFSAGSPIQLAAGATFQANLTPGRHEYYPVKIPVANEAVGQPMNVRIYPMEHPGPGYSLGYNSAEQLIEGTLPDGNYTLRVNTQGQPGLTGFLNFSVHGGPQEGPAITLVPNTSLAVTVKEEFQSGQSVFGEVTAEPGNGLTNTVPQRRVDVQVMLMPIEEFGSAGTAMSQPVEASQEHALVIPNVWPGRYRVHVQSAIGFAASIISGGTNLLRQPLVVGLGGSSSPIEVTLRDDGADVEGKVEEAIPCHVYFLPLAESSGQFRQTNSAPDGTFAIGQLPPGTYRVLAFDRQRNDLAYNDAESMRKLESKGQVIHVDAGEKERLRLRIISGGDSQ